VDVAAFGVRILMGADVLPDPNAGVGGTVLRTAEALRVLGHEVDAFWATDVGRRVRHGNLHYAAELPWRFRVLVRRHVQSTAYDVVQLGQPHAYLAARDHRMSGRPGIFINRSHGVELRYDEAMRRWKHRVSTGPPPRWKRPLSAALRYVLDRHWKWVARWSDGFVLPCHADREYLLERFPIPSWRARTIYHGVPALFVEDPPPALDRARLTRLLYVAQYAFFKGPDVVAAVANAVLPRHPALRLTWVTGRAAHPEIRRLLDPVAAERVELLDWRPQEELKPLLDSHGLFLFPSYFEGFGKACLEALVRGLPVLAADNGTTRDYIQPGVNGWLLPVGDAAPYVRMIERTLAQPDEALEMSQRARQGARAFTWRRCASEAVEFYRELAQRRESSPGRGPNF
jgi:glycosyltransferase involved in cell wall biosynthesis